MAKGKDADSSVHRDLHLTTPLTHGADVRAVQLRLNEIHHQHEIGFRLEDDGEAGEHTFQMVSRGAWIMGLPHEVVRRARHGGTAEEVTQKHLREPDTRTPGQKDEAEKRREEWRKHEEAASGGAQKAIEWARSKIGTSEQPAYSNLGPGITEWEAYCGVRAVPWCGCFVSYAVCHQAAAKIPDHTRLRYSGWIDYDARQHVNGLDLVPSSAARAGDIGTLEFEGGPPTDHVVLITGPPSGGYIPTLEGNTSPASSGSQFNGGTVAAKQRASGLFVTVARPEY